MEPISASVVVLHRHRGPTLEVYWVRRAENLKFLPGFWSFPGGRVDAADHEVRVPGTQGDAAARIAAAARELAEETGITLPPHVATFVPAGRSVTPEWAPLRYDATYYLVEAPDGAAPDYRQAGGELDDGEWITPADALARWTTGERITSPVVVHMLRALAAGTAFAAARVAAEAERETRSGRLFDLAPGVACAWLRTPTIPPATHTSCYVIGGRELVVIDPPSPYDDERAALDEALDAAAVRGRRVREIWLTHHHVDHVSGAAYLARRLGVPVAAHPRTAELVAPAITVARHLHDEQVEVVPGDDDAPDRRLRAIFTPGHAPGHLCFLEETTGFIVAGDMVAGIGTIVVDPDEGDMVDYLASLRRLKALGPRALLPSHGPIITNPAAKIDEYVQHRLWREEKVFGALARRGRATARDLVPDVYQDVTPAMHALAARSLLAHLIKLAKDGRARVEDDTFIAV